MVSSVARTASTSSVDPTNPADTTDVVTMTPNDLMTFCQNSLSGVETAIAQAMQTAQTNPSDPNALVDLQALVAQRQEIVDLTSNLIASYNKTAEDTIQNIGR
jgi:hypothetical protein